MTEPSFLIELTILVLAIFLGFEVISKVPPLLHTPLMSGTNAIHGNGFWNYYNQDMGARPNYDPETSAFGRNQGGGAMGGALVRDKLFWFAGAETTRQSTLAFNRNVEFPQLVITETIPADITYGTGRLDWNATANIRVFGSFFHENNLTTGGSPTSPFQTSF